LKEQRSFLPFGIRRVQTDNGNEYLKEKKLMHFGNYPKSSACIEQFNRTIKERFVYEKNI
jgi:hypothetical protein